MYNNIIILRLAPFRSLLATRSTLQINAARNKTQILDVVASCASADTTITRPQSSSKRFTKERFTGLGLASSLNFNTVSIRLYLMIKNY